MESLRKSNDSFKFRGSVKLDFDLNKNGNIAIELTNELLIQYVFGKTKLLFVSDFSFKKLTGNQYNYKNLYFTSTFTFQKYAFPIFKIP